MDDKKSSSTTKNIKDYGLPLLLIAGGILFYGVARLIEVLPTSAETAGIIVSGVGFVLGGLKNYLNKQNQEQAVITAYALDEKVDPIDNLLTENLLKISARLGKLVRSSKETNVKLQEHIDTTSSTHEIIKTNIKQLKDAFDEEKMSNKEQLENHQKLLAEHGNEIAEIRAGHKEIMSKLDTIDDNTKRISALETKVNGI